MYKIVHRDGYEVEVGFEGLKDAMARLRQLKRSCAGHLYVVDASTKVVKKDQQLNGRLKKRHRYQPKIPSL